MQKTFDDKIIQAVWEKGRVIPGYDPSKYRKDQCGAWITRSKYGNRKSEYGWEIDHITPKSEGGSDSLYNLRPLEWKNNIATSNGRLTCVVKANGKENKDI